MKKKTKSKIPTWKKEKVALNAVSYYLHTDAVDFYIFFDATEAHKPFIEMTSWLNGGSDEPLVLKEIELTPENVKDFVRDLPHYKYSIINETRYQIMNIAGNLGEILTNLSK